MAWRGWIQMHLSIAIFSIEWGDEILADSKGADYMKRPECPEMIVPFKLWACALSSVWDDSNLFVILNQFVLYMWTQKYSMLRRESECHSKNLWLYIPVEIYWIWFAHLWANGDLHCVTDLIVSIPW